MSEERWRELRELEDRAEEMRRRKLEYDPRPIKSVTMPGEGGQWWCVGREGVTKIELYFEDGQMAPVPWLAVYKGDSVVFRVPCTAVEYISHGGE